MCAVPVCPCMDAIVAEGFLEPFHAKPLKGSLVRPVAVAEGAALLDVEPIGMRGQDDLARWPMERAAPRVPRLSARRRLSSEARRRFSSWASYFA